MLFHYHMSQVIRKSAFAICEQQRRRSACVSAPSDQRLCYSLLRQDTSSFYIQNSSLQLVSIAVQPGLSLTWSENPKTGVLVTRLIYNKFEQNKTNSHVLIYFLCLRDNL